jgi:hypothetical protein
MVIKNYSGREINIRELYTGEAKCEEVGDYIFFAEKEDGWRWTIMAKKMCKTCPLELKCRDYALQNSVFGIWGGTTTKEREFIRTQLGIFPKEVMIGAA